MIGRTTRPKTDTRQKTLSFTLSIVKATDSSAKSTNNGQASLLIVVVSVTVACVLFVCLISLVGVFLVRRRLYKKCSCEHANYNVDYVQGSSSQQSRSTYYSTISFDDVNELDTMKLDIKISDLPLELTEQVCCHLAAVGPRNEWKKLAIRLGMEMCKIAEIESCDPMERSRIILEWWKVTQPECATVSKLVDILKDMRRLDLVRLIKRSLHGKQERYIEGMVLNGEICSHSGLYREGRPTNSKRKCGLNYSVNHEIVFPEDSPDILHVTPPKCKTDHESYSVVFDEKSELNRQGSSKSKTSNFSNYSSISGLSCPKPQLPETVNPDLCSWGIFTEKGGILKIKDTGVSLYIPKMALQKGNSQLIFIGLMNRKGIYPRLKDGQTVLSPAVICGPDGLEFDKPVCLTVPHNAVIDDVTTWTPQVQSCATVPRNENEVTNWRILEDPDDQEPPLGHVDRTSMQIMVDHFTGYCVVGQPQEIQKWIVPYCTEPKVDLDCRVRIYCIPATKAALEELHVEEKKLDGAMSDARKQLKISNNDKDIMVKMEKVKDGWEVDEHEQNIPFRDLWLTQNSQDHNCFPNVTFIFERVSQNQFSFSSIFKVNQDIENADSVKVKVASSIKRSASISSGYSSSLESGCHTDINFKIPLDVRRELSYRLDIKRDDCMDYRGFAERLGHKQYYIKWLEGDKCQSPIYDIIDKWEYSLSDKIPLSRLIEIFEEMERHDAVELLQNIPVS